MEPGSGGACAARGSPSRRLSRKVRGDALLGADSDLDDPWGGRFALELWFRRALTRGAGLRWKERLNEACSSAI